MRILVADDSFTMRRITMSKLKEIGFEEEDVIFAESGLLVLGMLNDNPDVSLVLLDWNMPSMNGIDCLKAIKASQTTKDVAVIMVTSETTKTKIMEALQNGASNYLIKPFDAKKLREAIGKIPPNLRQTEIRTKE